MEKRYLVIPFLFLIGLLNAELACIKSAPINQGSFLYIHCATIPSSSQCMANTSDQDGNFIMEYPEYPENTLQEFKQPITTSQDGQFTISMFMNDKKYFNGYNYSATITCFNPLDNSTNQTSLTFIPISYASNAGWFIGILVWLQNELPILAIILILLLFGLAIFFMILRAMGVWG
jgi:hypothetical protein